MTEVVRGELSRGGAGKTFGELWAAVAPTGGSKFALKSALGKGRERGEYAFDGVHYSLGGRDKKKAPTGSTGRGKRVETVAATS